MNFLAFKDTIDKIDSVINSKIISNENEILEIHILTNNIRSPKQIVRDVETAIITTFDYRLDRKIISIAQIESEYDEKIKRIKFEELTLTTNINTIECSLTLSYEEQEYTVSQTGINTHSNKRKIVADTTIKVVEKILEKTAVFDIQDVITQTSGSVIVTTILVNMLNGGTEEIIVGSAIVKNDINESIAKATLSAVNRRIQKGSI